MMALEKETNMYINSKTAASCSEETMADADAEVLNIIKSCHKKAADILKENISALKKIADYLIEEETITGEQFMKILNEFKETTSEE